MRALSGRKPTLEALRADEPIEKIYLQAGVGGGSIKEIVKLAKEKRIPLANLPPKQFNELTRHPNPQGVVAKLRDFEYADFDELVERSLRGAGLLLLMDEVQDTRNLGAMIRTAEATGCDGVAITKHRSAPLNETAAKTSAGAIAHLPVAQVVNLGEAIRRLKEAGFWIVGAAVENARDYREIDYRDKIALVVGNEEKGVRKKTAELCDFLAALPMRGAIESLNVSVAAGALLYEILRQRELG